MEAIIYVVQWNFDMMKGKGLAKYVRCNEVSLYRGSFPHVLLLLERGISFVMPRTSLYGGSS